MSTMSAERKAEIESRLVEDSVGAAVGAATGTGLSVFTGVASMVPWGLIIGTIAGVIFKELVQRKRRLRS